MFVAISQMPPSVATLPKTFDMPNADSATGIPAHVAREAVYWLLELSSGEAANAEHTRRRWQHWIDANALHAQAWQRIAQVDCQLRGLPAQVAMQTLAAPGLSRRHAVRLAVLITAGTGGLLAVRESGIGVHAWQQAAADFSTATGEQRQTVLTDGTRLQLNTASAVDLQYTASERLIVLRAGEILIQSAADPAPDPATGKPRPLRVRTLEGTARAIGTCFTVRLQDGFTSVAVLDGIVELTPRRGSATALYLSAGEMGRFTDVAAQQSDSLQDASAAWADGMLVADNMPLGDFIAELARYRPGLLQCAPDAAQLRVSGSYPLADIDLVLQALTRSLPVRISSRTRWWVTVVRKT